MTDNQRHLNEAVERFKEKYEAGVEEHGGQLWRKPVLDQMEEEAMDQFHYIQAKKVQDSMIRTIALRGKGYADIKKIHEAFQEIMNLIDYGNKEGERLKD